MSLTVKSRIICDFPCVVCQKTEQSRLPFPHEDKKPRGKIIREMTENKVLRIARGTVLGGAKLGAFVALFSGIQHGLAVHRGNHDALNTVAAGGVTGGTFSLTCMTYTHFTNSTCYCASRYWKFTCAGQLIDWKAHFSACCFSFCRFADERCILEVSIHRASSLSNRGEDLKVWIERRM